MTRFLNHIGGGAQKTRSIRTAPAPTSPCIRRENSLRFAATDFGRIPVARSFNQNGIAEFVRAKTVRVERSICAAQDRFVGERVQQVVVAGARLVRAGENCVDDAQLRLCANALVRDVVARDRSTETRSRMFESAYDGRTDGDDPPTLATCTTQSLLRRCWNAIRLVERQQAIERGVARRR